VHLILVIKLGSGQQGLNLEILCNPENILQYSIAMKLHFYI